MAIKAITNPKKGKIDSVKQKNTEVNAKAIYTWLSGYSIANRQELFQALWNLASKDIERNKYSSEILYPLNPTEAIFSSDQFKIELEVNDHVLYDRQAIEVILKTKIKLNCKQSKIHSKSKDKWTSWSLGFIPRDGGLNKTVKAALLVKKFQDPLIIQLTKLAPMKEPKPRLMNVKIAIPYTGTTVIDDTIIDIDSTNLDYRNFKDIVDFL